MPGAADHVLALLLTAVLPVYGLWTWKSFQNHVAAGTTNARVKAYRGTLLTEWLLFLALFVLWFASDRAFSKLGLTFEWNLTQIFCLTIVLVISGFFGWQWYRVRHLSAEKAESLKAQFESVAEMIPITDHERSWFILISLTAGFCEELLFRGFLIWYFQQYFTVILAAALSILIFALGHAYQGREGLLKTMLAGLVLTLLYLWSGSLLGSMVLHSVIDLSGGLTGSEILRAKKNEISG